MTKLTPIIILTIASMVIVGCVGSPFAHHKYKLRELTANRAAVMELSGPIMNIAPQLAAYDKIVHSGAKKVYVIINSMGGNVVEGAKFIKRIDSAKLQGIRTVCIIAGYAVSMAASIFAECDGRYAVFGSLILWHSAAYSGTANFNVKRAKELIERLEELNIEVWDSTRKYFSTDYFNKHFKEETFLSASELEAESPDFLTVITQLVVKSDKASLIITPNPNSVKIKIKIKSMKKKQQEERQKKLIETIMPEIRFIPPVRIIK